MNSITDPRRFIEQDKKTIISTVQRIPFILVEIATEGGKTFVIVIDEALPRDAEGSVTHRPHSRCTMKQSIEERFILDVLTTYTSVDSYNKLVKKIEGDSEFDATKATKKLRRYVESRDRAIQYFHAAKAYLEDR